MVTTCSTTTSSSSSRNSGSFAGKTTVFDHKRFISTRERQQQQRFQMQINPSSYHHPNQQFFRQRGSNCNCNSVLFLTATAAAASTEAVDPGDGTENSWHGSSPTDKGNDSDNHEYNNNRNEKDQSLHHPTTIPTTTTTLQCNNNYNNKRLWLAVVTEPTACDCDENVQFTLNALRPLLLRRITTTTSTTPTTSIEPTTTTATTNSLVDFICIRVTPSSEPLLRAQQEDRIVQMVQTLQSWKQQQQEQQNCNSTSSLSSTTAAIVLNSDWRHLAVRSGADGVHFKERHQQYIPQIRHEYQQQQQQRQNRPAAAVIIGMSVHGIESALQAFQNYQPDYFLVGTCYLTASHPEKKTADDVQGPALPGQVAQALQDAFNMIARTTSSSNSSSSHEQQPSNDKYIAKASNNDSTTNRYRSQQQYQEQQLQQQRPVVLAIGGITVDNCHEPVQCHHADGVAVIRAILQARDPARAAQEIRANMMMKKKDSTRG